MRNPHRIPKILNEIERVWKENPNLRLGQLIANVVDPKYLYEINDEILIRSIINTYKNI
jgi:uncharacterized protein YihD (DUF1040 family)